MKSDSCVHVAGIKAGIDPIVSPDSVVCNVSPNKIATPTIPGAAFQAQFPLSETGEESSVNSPHGTNNSCQKKVGKCRKNVYRKTRVQSRYSPQTSLEELKEICRVYPLKNYLVVLSYDIRNSIHLFSMLLLYFSLI